MLDLAGITTESVSWRPALLAVWVLPLSLLACDRPVGDAPGVTSAASPSAAPASAPAPTPKAEVLVFAASSLTNVFGDLEKKFERDNPGADVVLNLAGSQALRVQIENGAKADVFASASEEHMHALQKAGLMGKSTLLAENELVVAVPDDNPAKLERFADLPKATRIVLGAPDVPVGAYTKKLLARASASPELGADFEKKVEAHVVSREANVRLVLAKVELGEADAAIVYRTDVGAARKVKTIPVPADLAERARYDIAVASQAPHADFAARWVTYVTGSVGQELLGKAGFIVGGEPKVAP